MALLTPCKKFLTDLGTVIKEKGNASIVVGDIRADLEMGEDEGEYFFSIYYFSSEQTSFPFDDEKKFDALIEKFREGKLVVGDGLVKEITLDEGGNYSLRLENLQKREHTELLEDALKEGNVMFADANGKSTYYFLDLSMNVVASSRPSKIENGVLTYLQGEGYPQLKIEFLEMIMTFFENSKHPDINIEERLKLRKKIEDKVGRDPSAVVDAYI